MNIKSDVANSFIALMVGVAIVYMQHNEAKRTVRVVIAGISGGIGYVVSPEVDVPYLGANGEIILITGFAYAVIDLCFGIIRDRKLIIDTVRAILGSRGD